MRAWTGNGIKPGHQVCGAMDPHYRGDDGLESVHFDIMPVLRS